MNTAVKNWKVTSPSGNELNSGAFPKSKFKRFVINRMFRRLKKDNIAEITPVNNDAVVIQLKKEPVVYVKKKEKFLALDASINAEKETLKYFGSILIPAEVAFGLGALALFLGASEPLASAIFLTTFFLPIALYRANNFLIQYSASAMLNKKD